MNMIRYYNIGGTTIRFDCDAVFFDGESTSPFVCEPSEDCIECIFRAGGSIKEPEGDLLYTSEMHRAYRTPDGIVKSFSMPISSKTAAVTKEADGRFITEYDPSFTDSFSDAIVLMNAVGIESLLAENNIYILHCSFIELDGQAILFSGASGIGKSTRADMWCKKTDAHLINGDRALLLKSGGVFCAAGLPVSGSSQIFKNEMYPLKAVVFLSKNSENSTSAMNGVRAFGSVYKNTTINEWNPDFCERAAGFISELCSAVPVYLSQCGLDDYSVEEQMKALNL